MPTTHSAQRLQRGCREETSRVKGAMVVRHEGYPMATRAGPVWEGQTGPAAGCHDILHDVGHVILVLVGLVLHISRV